MRVVPEYAERDPKLPASVLKHASLLRSSKHHSLESKEHEYGGYGEMYR